MVPPHHLLIRVALAIQSQYAAFANRPTLFDLPHSAWQEVVRAARLLEYARRRRWSAAADELTIRVRTTCSATVQELNRITELLKPRTAPRIPSLRELYSELVALYDEYDHVRLDRKSGVLAVMTDPIVLEDMHLGPFEIQLRWSALPEPNCYSILAIEPNASSGDGGYVHPHVLSERLCEGDGRLPIQRALADGRLCDFFEIVTRVLDTYNAESAYLPLEDWHGVSCAGCGDTMSEDDTYACYRCETRLCFDCYENCSCCDDAYCSECVKTCTDCGDVYCRGCLRTCPDCEGDFCDQCRTENQRCQNCADEAQHELTIVDAAGSANPSEAAANPAASPAEADAARGAADSIFAHGLGQADVYARRGIL